MLQKPLRLFGGTSPTEERQGLVSASSEAPLLRGEAGFSLRLLFRRHLSYEERHGLVSPFGRDVSFADREG